MVSGPTALGAGSTRAPGVGSKVTWKASAACGALPVGSSAEKLEIPAGDRDLDLGLGAQCRRNDGERRLLEPEENGLVGGGIEGGIEPGALNRPRQVPDHPAAVLRARDQEGLPGSAECRREVVEEAGGVVTAIARKRRRRQGDPGRRRELDPGRVAARPQVDRQCGPAGIDHSDVPARGVVAGATEEVAGSDGERRRLAGLSESHDLDAREGLLPVSRMGIEIRLQGGRELVHVFDPRGERVAEVEVDPVVVGRSAGALMRPVDEHHLAGRHGAHVVGVDATIHRGKVVQVHVVDRHDVAHAGGRPRVGAPQRDDPRHVSDVGRRRGQLESRRGRRYRGAPAEGEAALETVAEDPRLRCRPRDDQVRGEKRQRGEAWPKSVRRGRCRKRSSRHGNLAFDRRT